MLGTCIYSLVFIIFFFNDTATTEIYTLSLHDALPISIVTRIKVSPLAQGRGLKPDKFDRGGHYLVVAPCTGAWIETLTLPGIEICLVGRPLHRGVD